METRRIRKSLEEIMVKDDMKQLESENTNFRECVNYLIQLFYKTDKKYSCNRTKVGKLLSILAFRYAIIGIKLFEERIYEYPKCGTIIEETLFLPRDVYFHYILMEDAKKIIFVEELNEEVDIPEEYKNVGGLSDDVRTAIEEVFFNFGAYSTRELAEELNPIVEYDGVCNEDGTINLEAIACLDKDCFEGNRVIEYLKVVELLYKN